MVEKDKINQLEKIIDEIQKQYETFARVKSSYDNNSSLFSVSGIDLGNGAVQACVGIAGEKQVISRTIFSAMKSNKKIANIILYAASCYANEKLEILKSNLPESLGKTIGDIFEESIRETFMGQDKDDTCDCPICTARRNLKNNLN